MANYGAKILNNAVSSLTAQQAVIATTGNNIANANTAGYVRRTVDLETRTGANGAGINVGNGVAVGGVSRASDEFLNKLVLEKTSSTSASTTESDIMARAEELFDLTGNRETIGSTLTDFFTAINDLTADPSNIELRQNFLQKANDLVSTVKSTYNTLASLQREADSRIQSELDTVNGLTTQIAQVNGLIAAQEANGTVAADERDQRDVLMQKLAEKISYTSLEQPDGSVLITIANGFPLVNGAKSRTLSYTDSPSFATGTTPPALDAGLLHYITYDYSNGGATPSDIDLTTALQGGDGTIGALLRARGTIDPNVVQVPPNPFQTNGQLVEIAARVESFARTLVTSFNNAYRGYDTTKPLNNDEDSVTAGFQTPARDLNNNAPAVFGLFNFTGSSDADANGLVTNGDIAVANVSSLLSVVPTTPQGVAAGWDSNPVVGAVTVLSGDGRNMENLAKLRTDKTLVFSNPAYGVGGSFLTGTFEESYTEMLTKTGNFSAAAKLAASVNQASLTTAQARRDEVSAVSLDEEFTKLIQFQKAYTASAKMIKVADELLQQIVQLI